MSCSGLWSTTGVDDLFLDCFESDTVIVASHVLMVTLNEYVDTYDDGE